MTVSRSKLTDLVQRALVPVRAVSYPFLVRQVAIGPQTNPDLRLRITKAGDTRLSATEMHEVERVIAAIEVEYGLRHSAKRRFASMIRVDYSVSDNPSLARSEHETEYAKRIGEAIDQTLAYLEFNPVVKLHTVEATLSGEDYTLPEIDKAIDFCLSRSLAHKVVLKTTRTLNGVDEDLQQEYLIASAARMRVSGSQADYGLMTLLLAAMERKPEPKSKRGPKPQHKRNEALARRERDSANGYRRGH